MNDLFESIIREARTPERADSLMDILDILEDDYEDDLYAINNIASMHDSSADAIGEVESLIFQCAFDLFTKLGVHLPLIHITNRPDFAHDVLITILDHIEDYQDYEGLLACLDAGHPPVIALADIISMVRNKPSSFYVDYITDIEPRTITAIRRVLTAKTLADYDDEMDLDPERGAIASRVVNLYPQTPMTELFADGGYNLDFDEMVEKVDLDTKVSESSLVETAGIVTAAICAVTQKEYDYAYGELHHCADLIVASAALEGRDLNVIQITRVADRALREIFALE